MKIIFSTIIILSLTLCLSCICAADNNTYTQDAVEISDNNPIISSDTDNNLEIKQDTYINKTEKNIKSADSNIVYVSNKGNDNNIGSKTNPKKTIKNAIESSKDKTTIYIKSGTYNEHGILINKNITLEGENPKTTIINAQNKHLFTIAANTRVSIKTLSIKNAFDENGGAIYNKGNLSIKHLRIYSNKARNGGAIYNKGKLYAYKSLFMYNNAKYGSAIYNLNSFEANKCVFASNTAVEFGAIYSAAYINLLSCNFTTNTNSSILIEKSGKKSYINSCLFSRNNAIHGAGIYNIESPLEIKYTYFNNNSVTNYGACLYNSGQTTVTNCKFSNNKASNGGAIANKNITQIMHSTLDSNTATKEGAGIYNTFDLTVSNTTFKNNYAENGASISSTSNVKKILNIDSSTFTSNKAKVHGSAIYITNKNQLNIKNSIISYNTNRPIYLRCDNGISNTIYNCNITKNKGDTGSAVFNQKTVLTITKSIITKNNNTVKGSVYNNYGKTTINYCIIGENKNIDVANYKGSVNANYNWWLKNSVTNKNVNGLTVNNWVFLKISTDTKEVNKTSTTTASINQVYNNKTFTTIDASKLPAFTFVITINGRGISKNIEKTVVDGKFSINNVYTKEGEITTTAYTYNCKVTEKFTLKSNLINSKITSLFVQIGYSISRSIVNNWINAGITDVYVQTTASTSNTKNLQNVATLCKNTPIRVHAWVICFSGDDISTSRQNVLRSFIGNVIKINGVNGVCLDYVRYSGLHPNIVNPSKITEFVKSVNNVIKSYNSKILLSACVFAEKGGTKTYYGQDYEQMSRYLDVMLPMTYKYDYKSGRDWLKSATAYVVSHAKYCKVVSVLQTYNSNLNRLSKSELEADARAVMAAGSYGYGLFRHGLISYYPKSAVNL